MGAGAGRGLRRPPTLVSSQRLPGVRARGRRLALVLCACGAARQDGQRQRAERHGGRAAAGLHAHGRPGGAARGRHGRGCLALCTGRQSSVALSLALAGVGVGPGTPSGLCSPPPAPCSCARSCRRRRSSSSRPCCTSTGTARRCTSFASTCGSCTGTAASSCCWVRWGRSRPGWAGPRGRQCPLGGPAPRGTARWATARGAATALSPQDGPADGAVRLPVRVLPCSGLGDASRPEVGGPGRGGGALLGPHQPASAPFLGFPHLETCPAEGPGLLSSSPFGVGCPGWAVALGLGPSLLPEGWCQGAERAGVSHAVWPRSAALHP